jgi:peptidoglycan-N-acetylglucosamine deacetylase
MKTVYLTIDDAPSASFMPKMEYLLKHNIPALLFCVGHDLQKRPDDIITAIKNGFVVGNHSFSHPHFSDLTIEECRHEIQETDKIIDNLYNSAGIKRKHKLFRFPFFDAGGFDSGEAYEAHVRKSESEWNQFTQPKRKNAIQNFLFQLGYAQLLFPGINLKYFKSTGLLDDIDIKCTFDQCEYFLNNPAAPWGLSEARSILARIDEDVPYAGRSLNCDDTADIILIHDHEHTSELFFKIIDRYLEKGFNFKMVY